MPTPHNSAQKGDYAEAVLLPGDPLRSKWIAETSLTDVKQVNALRNSLGFTRTWNGNTAPAHASARHQPAPAPCVEGHGRLLGHGVLGVEMESAALYTLAARFGVKALTICAVSDDLIRHEFMSADERQSSLKDMIALALDVATQ